MTMLDTPTAPPRAAHNGAPHPIPAAPAGNVSAQPSVGEPAPLLGGPVTERNSAVVAKDPKAKSRARARWWYWTWLLFATVVSIGGNVIHAWMAAPATSLKFLAAVAAAVTPLLLLGATHTAALLIKNRRSEYRRVDAFVFAAALTITFSVGVVTFVTSYFSLRALIVVLGGTVGQACLWPIAVDLSQVCSTLALLTSASANNDESDSVTRPLAREGAAPGFVVAANTGPSSPAERRLWWESIAAVVQEHHPDVKKIAELSVPTIAGALQRLYDDGDSQRAVCSALEVHHREVRTIKQTADEILARVVPTTELAV